MVLYTLLTSIAVCGLWGASKLGFLDNNGGPTQQPNPPASALPGETSKGNFACRIELDRRIGEGLIASAVVTGDISGSANLVIDSAQFQNSRLNRTNVDANPGLEEPIGHAGGVTRIGGHVMAGGASVPCQPFIES